MQISHLCMCVHVCMYVAPFSSNYCTNLFTMRSSTLFFPLLAFTFLLSNPIRVVESQKKTYIVHVEPPETTVLDASFDREAWYRSFLPATIASSSEDTQMIHTYNQVATGFAARLTEEEVNEMSKKEGFVLARPSRVYSLKTTHTPSFLGLNLPMGSWNRSNFGQGVIIGVVDDGVTPDHPSFSGDGMPPPPSKWKGRCEFNSSICNNKLIGARVFLQAYAAEYGPGNVTFSPVDEFGHGTHTSSTAAGAIVANAQVLGNAGGVASGVAPHAHVAMYRVCGEEDCVEADILAALEAAISDGVDVLSISLGLLESTPFDEEATAIGGFRAMEKGVFVSCAAGNEGPGASSVVNDAPWLLTVAASTTDRRIRASVELGNGLKFDGESLFQTQIDVPAFIPLVYAGVSGKPDAALCGNCSLDGLDVKGKIVLCERGITPRIEKGSVVSRAGGFAMILMNQESDGFTTEADAHVLPASHVSYADGLKIKEYINSTTSPTARLAFKGTVFAASPSPAIAGFSSRGPSLPTPGILKPDIAGPGVGILAAWPFPASPYSTGLNFNVISGTSMSTPHLSGIAALIKSEHPDWSPAAIKSAIMTTAEVLDRKGTLILDEKHQPADLFATGAGHVCPNKALDPGLVYDLHAPDYIPYLCGLGYTNARIKVITGHPADCANVNNTTGGELNYPSISVAFGSGVDCVVLERTAKNVGEANSMYWAEIDAPTDVSVSVEPKILQFYEVKEEIKFKVEFRRSHGGGIGSVSQGHLKWVSKSRTVRSPISVTFN